MKRRTPAITLVALVVAWLATEAVLTRRAKPPRSVVDVKSFLDWRPGTQEFTLIPGPSGDHLLAMGPRRGLLASGPPAYVFDPAGRLVDWSRDIGDDAAFNGRWPAQLVRGLGRAVPRGEVGAWLEAAATPRGNLEFRDGAAQVVATANLHMPDPLPPDGGRFEGAWELLWSKPPFPADATTPGKYSAEVHDREVFINLAPGMSDNNVVLVGSKKQDALAGGWQYATFAGGKTMGTFRLANGAAAGTGPPASRPAR
jgi:hypothetical protein